MENLSKENFWNALFDKYPDQVKVFCDWIDNYKTRVDWGNLFCTQSFAPNGKPVIKSEDYAKWQRGDLKVKCYKYHDLPIALQLGIFLQFTIEHPGLSGYQFGVDCYNNLSDIPDMITKYFENVDIK